MIKRWGILLLVALLAGCASQRGTGRTSIEALPMHYVQFDVDLGYRITTLGSQTLVDGALRSLRYQYMEDAEVWVAALDAEGRPVARSVSYLVPRELRQGEVTSFSIKLPVLVQPGSVLRFTYRYLGTDGGDSRGEERLQSFDAVVPPLAGGDR